MDPSHPLGVARRQVVVDGDQVDTVAAEGVEVDRHGRDQGLALAGLHLGNGAPVERPGADDLDVVVALGQHPFRRLADHGIGLGFEIVQ